MWEQLLLKPVLLPGLPLFHNIHLHFRFCIIIYSFVSQYAFCFYWYCYYQKQSSDAVLQKICSYKFREIRNKTPKKRFWHRCFLVNSAKFLIAYFSKNLSDDCFSINIHSVYCPTMTFRIFKNDVTHIFWLSIFPV